jgi:hypothetical protein
VLTRYRLSTLGGNAALPVGAVGGWPATKARIKAEGQEAADADKVLVEEAIQPPA